MNITVKIYSCNYETYSKVYRDAVKRAYAKDNVYIDVNNLDKNNIKYTIKK